MRIAPFILLTLLLFPLAGDEPEITATAAISIDMDTGEIIYARNIDSRLFPASMTKMMTALLLAENRQPEDILIYPAEAREVVPFILKLQPGERLTAKDAMNALLLYSANDIAFMIAENIAGDVQSFSKMMNDKARELGMKQSHFITSNGLHHPEHYTTPYDMSLLLRAFARSPWIMETTIKRTETVITLEGSRFDLKNRNKLAAREGCVGGKTGWTTEAGRCFASLFERENRKTALVVMKSQYDSRDTRVFEDTLNLEAWSLERKKTLLYPPGKEIRRVKRSYKVLPFIGPERELIIPLEVREGIFEYTADPDLNIESVVNIISPWKLKADEPAGYLRITGREIQHTYALYPGITGKDILKKHLIFYLTLSGFVITLVFLILFLNRKKKADIHC